jgi:hypothetical protein
MSTIFDNVKTKVDESETISILMKLEKDGYVLSKKNINNINEVEDYLKVSIDKIYVASFEGKFLLQIQKGYVGLNRITRRKNRNQILKDWLLIVGTWMAGIGALALVGWEIYKTFFLCE